MKKLILFVAVFLFSHSFAFSQSCLPEGIWFTTQEEIDNFQTNYPGCTEIEGDVTILGDNITNLYGLSALTSVGGHLYFGWRDDFWWRGNPNLTSLAGLDQLNAIGSDLLILLNPLLTDFKELDNLTSIGGWLEVTGNEALTDLTGLENLTGLSSIHISGNPILKSLAGLDNISYVQGYVSITNNITLPELTGLNNLTHIGDVLEILKNECLIDLGGLNKLVSTGRLYIRENPSLNNLIGLNNLTSITGYLGIYVGHNENITSLSGLDNIISSSISNLEICYNSSLSTCEVQSICDYLAAPNGTIQISNNAPGCNSPEEVEEACETIGMDEPSIFNIQDSGFDMHCNPNPFNTHTTIEFELQHTSTVSILILNAMGAPVAELHPGKLPAGQQRFTWYAGNLPEGIYYCRLLADKQLFTGKIIKIQ